MAANNGEVNVKIKVDAETNGAVKVKQNLNEVGKAANNAANKSKGAFDRIKSSIGNVSKSAGALSKIFTGLGVAGLFTGAIASISKIASSFGSAKKDAEAFQKIQEELASSKAIQNLSIQYEKLKSSIADASAQKKHELDILDIQHEQTWRKAEAQIESEKQQELAALDPNASDYQERKAAIEARYASRSESMKADKKRADLIMQRQRINSEADSLDKEAAAEDANTKLIRGRLSQARAQQTAAQSEAVELNENDKTGTMNAIGKTLGQLFTGQWGRMSEAKTAEGDQVRREAAKRAADLELRVQELEAQLEASKSKAASLRNTATRTREKSEAMGGMFDVLQLEKSNTSQAGQTAVDAAQSALLARHTKDADAASAAMLLSSQEASLRSQIAQEQARKADAAKNVWNAKNAYDLDPSRSSLESLQKAEGAAKDVDFAADRAINALTKTLEDVSKRLQAAQAHLEKQSSQSHYAWSESPAGE